MKKLLASALTFIIVLNLIFVCAYAGSNSLNASIDNATKVVTITGNSTAGEGKKVMLLVSDSDQNIKHIDQGNTGAGGSISFQFPLSDVIKNQTYNVRVWGENLESINAAFVYRESNTPNIPVDTDTAGSGTTTPQPTTQPAPVVDKNGMVKVDLKPVKDEKTSTAVVKLDNALLDKAFELAKNDDDGVKHVVLSIGESKDAKTYMLELPGSRLVSDSRKQVITVETPLGVIIVPGNMFTSSDNVAGSTVGLSIGLADKSSINSDLKEKIGNRPVIELKAFVAGKQVSWNNSDAPVTISIPYTPTEDELKDPEHIVVWYLDGSGKAVSIPDGKYDASSGKIVFTTTHFSTYAVAFVKKTFNDIGKYSWAVKPVEILASKGIIEGTTESDFSPGRNITRGEFTMWLIKTLGLNAKFDSNFDDVKRTSPYYDTLGIAKKLNIASGSGNNKFSPESQISRQDMMALTIRALKTSGKKLSSGTATDLGKFTDVSKIAKYAAGDVATMVKEGLIVGSGSKICPTAATTRAEVAVMLYKVYKQY